MIDIELIYAFPEDQTLIPLSLPEGSTIQDSILKSGILLQYPELNSNLKAGIFGKHQSLETPLKTGDRVEIYRPLALSPMERRRLEAKRQKAGRK